MLVNKNKSNNIFSKEVVSRMGMDSTGIFQVCGTAAETQFAWDPQEQKFTDIVSGFGIWVHQDYKQFKQNPILVVVPKLSQKKAEEFEFGDNVQFDDLGGYYSKRNHIFRWQARNINKISMKKEGEK